jgi:hypothetical protein
MDVESAEGTSGTASSAKVGRHQEGQIACWQMLGTIKQAIQSGMNQLWEI